MFKTQHIKAKEGEKVEEKKLSRGKRGGGRWGSLTVKGVVSGRKMTKRHLTPS